MKKWMLLVLIAGCGRGDAVRDFIPGVYVREFSHEFAFGYDTLSVSHLDENTYLIRKSSGYRRISEDGGSVPVLKKENWTGVYNEREGHVMEQRRGKLLLFRPEEGRLLLGASVYYKVK